MELSNLILIGMPGAGKSTLGILTAKALGLSFLDTDVAIQAQYGQTLSELISRHGLEGFCRIEEEYLGNLNVRQTVIATGGSAVYYDGAMNHLKQTGRVVYLKVPLEILRSRLANMASRGVVIEPGQTLETLFKKRSGLYERYADLIIPLAEQSHEQAVQAILQRLQEKDGKEPIG